MIVEVTGVNTWNKGAELMLVAVCEHLRAVDASVRLAIEPTFGTYLERARYGLLQKAEIARRGRSRLALALLPAAFRETYGLVRERDVDAVLDASGFAFGDQHPAERAERFAAFVERMRAGGRPVVLLPQALGPFDRPRVRAAFARIAAAADLVFARDEVSLGHARAAAQQPERVVPAPDLTLLVEPPRRTASDASDAVCIVPNQRMIEKAGGQAEADAYLPLLACAVRTVEEAGLRPVVVRHEVQDEALVAALFGHLGRTLPVVREEDPVALKRVLGESRLVVASRFHALVGALSQGVPCVASSWSHKYEMLMRDFGCEEMVVPVLGGEGPLQARIREALGPRRAALEAGITAAAARQAAQVRTAWTQVDRLLGLQRTVNAEQRMGKGE